MPENIAAYEKINVVVAKDIPANLANKVLQGLKAEYSTYETAGGKDKGPQTHETQFMVSGRGEFVLIEHIGRLKRPLKDSMAAFAAGITWMAERTSINPQPEA
jgi:hypothetical protein